MGLSNIQTIHLEYPEGSGKRACNGAYLEPVVLGPGTALKLCRGCVQGPQQQTIGELMDSHPDNIVGFIHALGLNNYEIVKKETDEEYEAEAPWLSTLIRNGNGQI